MLSMARYALSKWSLLTMPTVVIMSRFFEPLLCLRFYIYHFAFSQLPQIGDVSILLIGKLGPWVVIADSNLNVPALLITILLRVPYPSSWGIKTHGFGIPIEPSPNSFIDFLKLLL